jgi:hypothetical protein
VFIRVNSWLKPSGLSRFTLSFWNKFLVESICRKCGVKQVGTAILQFQKKPEEMQGVSGDWGIH